MIRPCGEPQGTVVTAMTWRQTKQEERLDGETIEGEINKKITGNEKAISFGIHGNTGLPHGLWVRRFSGIWERCARRFGSE